MKSITRLFFVAVAVSGFSFSAATENADTPVSKVLELMENLLEKSKKDKFAEAKMATTYLQWCDDVKAEKITAIQNGKDEIEQLKAKEVQHQSDIDDLARQIVGHDENIAKAKADVATAADLRASEKADYIALHKDLSESIDALKRAVDVLKKQSHDRAQASALVQVQALSKLALIPSETKSALNAFLQSDDEDLVTPKAHGYEFQSSHVVEMLYKLQMKFEDERNSVEVEESNKKHASNLMIQDLTGQVKQNLQSVADKTNTKGEHSQGLAEAKSDRKETENVLAADEKFHHDTQATCDIKRSNFAARQQLRAEEITAIEKAIEIISDPNVKGAAAKHLPTLAQVTALAQLRGKNMGVGQAAAQQFLMSKGQELNSRILSAIAMKVGSDPFRKVKEMIQDLISTLEAEASNEADEKAFCDKNLAENKANRDNTEAGLESLNAEKDTLEVEMQKLAAKKKELEDGIAENMKMLAEATAERMAEKGKNKETIQDAKAAQDAVAKALQVLKAFYEKAGQAVVLAQQQPEAPAIFEGEFTGHQAGNEGVVGMLEVIQSDFARLEADTASSESESQSEYDNFKADSDADTAAKEQDHKMKSSSLNDASASLEENTVNMANEQRSMDSYTKTKDALQEKCLDTGLSYEERVAKREAEMQSLQEALSILGGDSE